VTFHHSSQTPSPDEAASPRRRFPVPRPAPIVSDLAAIAVYWIAAMVVLSPLWARPSTRMARPRGQDQIFFEWLLAHAARSVTSLENPLFSTRMNVPDGVNMMANTSALGVTIPLTPITLAFGPAVAFVSWATAALALTATAWYFFLSRRLRLRRTAAFLGGAFCGFSPGMIAHLHGQPNISSQFLVPLILWQVMRLLDPGRAIRGGVALGLLVTYQAFINEEILFVTAWVCAVLAVSYAVLRWRDAKRMAGRFAAGLGVAAAVAAVLLAYPLWFQFLGPAHYRSLPDQFQRHVADVGSYTAYSAESLGGALADTDFSLTIAENNSFFGWPLVATVALIVLWLRHELVVRLAAIVGVLFALLSFGDELHYARKPTGVPGPWSLLDSVPPFAMAVPTRLALVVTAAIGVLLAVSVDRVQAVRVSAPSRMPSYRALWLGALAAVLLPVVPTRLDDVPRAPTPAFISSGAWRSYVGPDQALVPLPLPNSGEVSMEGMVWAADTILAFRIPHGYFLGPDPRRPDRKALLGAAPSEFSQLMESVEKSGRVVTITPALRAELVRDLRRWNAAVLVLRRDHRRADAIRRTVEGLAGPAQPVDDVWLWDVRDLVATGG